PRLAPLNGSRLSDRGPCATRSPIARGPWAAVHALRTRGEGLPSRVWWWCRARPTHSARHARAAPGALACAGPVHHPPSPSHAAPAPPTGRASLNTVPGASDTARQAARGMLGVGARLVSTPEAGTTGSRARHGHGERRSP